MLEIAGLQPVLHGGYGPYIKATVHSPRSFVIAIFFITRSEYCSKVDKTPVRSTAAQTSEMFDTPTVSLYSGVVHTK